VSIGKGDAKKARYWYPSGEPFNYPQIGLAGHDRFDFVRGDVERDVHGALARAFRKSISVPPQNLWVERG